MGSKALLPFRPVHRRASPTRPPRSGGQPCAKLCDTPAQPFARRQVPAMPCAGNTVTKGEKTFGAAACRTACKRRHDRGRKNIRRGGLPYRAQLFGQLGVGQNALKIGEFPQSCQQAPLRAALYGAAVAVRYIRFSSRPINRPEAAPYRPRRPTAAPAHGVSRRLFSTGSRRSARRTKQCGRS